MTNWNNISMLTNGLKHLGTEINEAFPDRKTDSDGAIGDYAHTQEKSGHNPDDTSKHNAEWDGDSDNKPEIRAIDVDSDLIPGDSGAAQRLVDHIVGLKPSSVLRYVIYNRKIYEASNGWGSRKYTGASPHTEHIHFSGAYSDASDENTHYDYQLEDVMAIDYDKLAQAVLDAKVHNSRYSTRTVRDFFNDFWDVRDSGISNKPLGTVTNDTAWAKLLNIVSTVKK